MTGSTLSHYDIEAELGRGGMGVVYRALDTRLDRTVAIKVLPASALSSTDDRARFYREAKAAAALNHPHIAAIHEIDEAVPEGAPADEVRPFIAMEFIDGDGLDERIARGPLPLKEAVRIASQIAEALKAAHAKAIVHRDIKSANIMLTAEGQAKVLDFGLAQTAHSTKLTLMGSTLGTAAYMSPEQALGEEVDGRTDLWALGVVLYEMIAGRNPFGGDYEQAVVYSILNEDPEPLTGLRTGVPMELERIVNKALEKDVDVRYQTAADLLADLKAVGPEVQPGMASSSMHSSSRLARGAGPAASGTSLAVSRKQVWLGLAITVVLTTIITLGAVSLMADGGEDRETIREYAINIPGVLSLEDPDVSPNRTRIAFQGRDTTGRVGVFEWEMFPGGELHYLEGSEEGSQPSYSPDGRFLTYNPRGRPHPIRVHASGGGPPQPIPGTEMMWMVSWEDNETIVATEFGGSLLRIGLNGTREVIASPDTTRGQVAILINHIDSSGRYAATFVESVDTYSIGMVDLATNEHWILVEEGAIWPYFVDDDILLYSYTASGADNWPGVQVVQRISADRKELLGSPVALKYFGESPGYAYAMEDDGSLYRSANFTNTKLSFLMRHELTSGAKHDLVLEYPRVTGVNPSPDGRFLAMIRYGESQTIVGKEIELVHLDDSRVESLIRGDSIATRVPLWAPDGSAIFYSQVQDGIASIYRLQVDLSSPPRKVLENAVHLGMSNDGTMMAFARPTSPAYGEMLGMSGIYIYSFKSDSVEPHAAAIDVSSASFSPDNRYLAYESDGQVWVDRLFASNPRRIAEGLEPLWDPSGDYLYYTGDPLRSLQRILISLRPTFALRSDAESLFDQWFSGAFRIDFDRGFAYSEAQINVDLGDDATIIRMENFPEFVRKAMGREQ